MKKKFFGLIILILLLTAIFGGCNILAEVDTIAFVNSPDNKTFEVGTFDYSDYTIAVTYTDKSTKTITLSEDMISEYDRMLFNSVGEHEISIKYENKVLTFKVKIVLKQMTDEEEEEVIAPYIQPIDVVYDGLPHIIRVEGDLPENATIIYPEGYSFTEAGEYSVSAKIVASGYETETIYSTVIIRKATYDFSSLKLDINYGEDENGNKKTSFVYDGAEHGATLVGTIPDGLSNPQFMIGLKTDPQSTYKEGLSATDAGEYTIIASFTSSDPNYENTNLSISTTLKIDKKPIITEALKDVVFESKTYVYDGEPHRIIIENITLPEDVGLEYQDENGKPFNYRTEANEDGYTVVAKLIASNPNYDIVNTLTAKLYIVKADYLNPNDIELSWENQLSTIEYNDEEHNIVLKGISSEKQATAVKCFVVDGKEVTSFVNAQKYTVEIKFNDLGNNYNALEPITREITITQTPFTTARYEFNDVTTIYDGEKYSLTYTEQSLPKGVKATFSYVATSTGVKTDGIPTNLVKVDDYACTIHFDYNINNYSFEESIKDELLNSVKDKVVTLSIQKRQYDAKGIINLYNATVNYEVGVDQSILCGFDEQLPAFITSYDRIILDPDKKRTDKIAAVGTYTYYYRFWYFDGTETVYADSNVGTIRILGKQIKDEYYSIICPQTFTYNADDADESNWTSSMPEITINVTEPVISVTLTEYTYIAPNSEDTIVVVGDAERLANSYNAGTHNYKYVVSAKEYESITVLLTVVVNQKARNITLDNYTVSNYSGEFDGENHSNQLTVVSAIEDINTAITLVSSTTQGTKVGTDIGVYNYKVDFTCVDNNYFIESATNLTYTVTITPYDLSTKGDNMFDLVDGLTGTIGTETVSDNAKLKSVFNNSITTSNTVNRKYCEYTYTGEFITVSLSASYDTLFDTKVDKTKITFNLYDLNADRVYSNITLDDINTLLQNANTYYIQVNIPTENICFGLDNGNPLYGLAYIVKINPVKLTLGNVKTTEGGSISIAEDASKTKFTLDGEGLNDISGDDILKYQNCTMLQGTTTFDGGFLYTDILSAYSKTEYPRITRNWSYVKVNRAGTIYYSSDTMVFAYIDGEEISLDDNKDYTPVGTYYILIDFGENYIEENNSCSKLVVKITVNPYILSSLPGINITNYNNPTQSLLVIADQRKYYTNASSIKAYTNLTSSNKTSINYVDSIDGNLATFNGKTVQQYNVTFNGDLFKIGFIDGLDNSLAQALTFDYIYTANGISYNTTNGLYLKDPTKSVTRTGYTIDELNADITSLYLTDSEKTVSYVGLYYLYVTVNCDEIDIETFDNKQFVFCVQVNQMQYYQSKYDGYFNYQYDSTNYNFKTGTLPEIAVDYTAGDTYFSIDETSLYSAIKELGVTEVNININGNFAAPIVSFPDVSDANITSDTTVKLRFYFNDTVYGGGYIEKDLTYYPMINLDMSKIIGSSLEYSSYGGVDFVYGTAINVDGVIEDATGKIRLAFETLGYADSIVNKIMDCVSFGTTGGSSVTFSLNGDEYVQVSYTSPTSDRFKFTCSDSLYSNNNGVVKSATNANSSVHFKHKKLAINLCCSGSKDGSQYVKEYAGCGNKVPSQLLAKTLGTTANKVTEEDIKSIIVYFFPIFSEFSNYPNEVSIPLTYDSSTTINGLLSADTDGFLNDCVDVVFHSVLELTSCEFIQTAVTLTGEWSNRYELHIYQDEIGVGDYTVANSLTQTVLYYVN